MSTEPAWVHGEQGERSAQIIQVESGRYAAVVAICGALCGISCIGSWWAVTETQKTATEYRVSQGLEKTRIAEIDVLKSRINRLEDKSDAKR